MDRREDDRRIALPLFDKIEFVPVQKIIRLEADRNYTLFFLDDGKKQLVSKTLKEFEELLVPHGFIRTHQSHLVNLAKIQAYVKSDGGYMTMEDGSQVPISRLKKDEVLKRILK